MGGEGGHPAVFLLVYFLGIVPGKGRQIFKLFLRLVTVLVGGTCAGQRALAFQTRIQSGRKLQSSKSFML